jgi:hypothetical protein
MKQAIPILLLMPMLAACAPQAPVFKPVSVDVPIAVPCRAQQVAPPDFALSHVSARDDAFVKTRAALVELDQRKAYEQEIQSQLSLCQ